MVVSGSVRTAAGGIRTAAVSAAVLAWPVCPRRCHGLGPCPEAADRTTAALSGIRGTGGIVAGCPDSGVRGGAGPGLAAAGSGRRVGVRWWVK